MKLKQLISGISALAVSASFSFPASANIIGDADDGIISELSEQGELITTYAAENPISLFDGDVTDDNPVDGVPITAIEINSADDLKNFRDTVNGTGEDSLKARVATVNLNCNIDLGGEEWIPIGTPSDPLNLYSNSFNGTFNGNGHTISNFKITNTDLRVAGLFGTILALRKATVSGYENDISVSDLTISDAEVNITGNTIECASVLCGIAYMPSAFSNVNVKSSSINVIKPEGQTLLSGGMVLAYGKADIDGAYAEGDINLSSQLNTYCGGIIGIDDDDGDESYNDYARPHDYKNCTSAVNLTVKGTGNVMVGGIAGYLSKDISVVNCSYLSDHSINLTGTLNSSNIAGCYASGIVGYAHSSFADCTTGDVTIKAEGQGNVGVSGITAMLYHDMTNCSSEANLTAIGGQNTIRTYAGGVAALFGPDSTSAKPLEQVGAVVENCYWTGKSITIDTYSVVMAGGISGRAADGFKIKNCYADFDSIDINIHDGATNAVSGTFEKSIVNAGGAIGSMLGAEATQLAASGKFNLVNARETSKVANSSYVGGIVGYIYNGSYFYTNEEDNAVKAIVPSSLTMSHSDVELNVTGDSVYSGGIAGYLSYSKSDEIVVSRITDCASFGNVTASPISTSLVGGGVGYSIDSYMADCASFGDLMIISRSATAIILGGGFVGRLKEANIVWSDAENPMSQTYRCYAGGKVSVLQSSTNLSCGPFTDAVVSNGSQQPVVEVTPYYENCYYAAEPVENAVGTAIAAADKNSYETFDFTNFWTMRDGNAVPMSAAPAVCNVNYTEENGEPVRINTATVSLPDNVKEIAIVVNNMVSSKAEKVKTVPIGEIKPCEKYFKTIAVDYDIEPFTTVDIVAVEKDALLINAEAVDGSVFHATLVNGSDENHTINVYAAEYDENGRMKKFTVTPYEVEANTVLPIAAEVSDETTKVCMWEGLSPLCSPVMK